MKRGLLVIGLIFAMAATSVRAQVTYCYRQDFESATPTGYSVSTGGATQTSIKSGGARAMKLTHTRNQEVVLTLDTLDFSDSAAWNYYTLEFMHIAFIDPLDCASGDRTNICRVEVKRPGQNSWMQLNSSHYKTDPGSNQFRNVGSFSKRSYDTWTSATAASNMLWQKERFDIEQVFQGVPAIDRQLIVRFIICARTANTGVQGWYLDDITIRASSQQMVAPKLTMISFPDNIKYPSSRGARLVANLSTSVSAGINSDSVYAEYRVGNSPTVHRAYLHPTTAGGSRYVGRIPFHGYDTVMTYHLVVKDSTRNNNTSYYPENANQWERYRCVRGITHDQPMAATTQSSSDFPFPYYADNRSEFVYDSLLMAELGYGPGAIKTFRYRVASSLQRVTRPHLQIRMANVPNSWTTTSTSTAFTTNAMQIVYDSAFVIEQAAANSEQTVTLQDTFFYSGGDLLVQIIYNGDQNVPATPLRHASTPFNKQSLYMTGHEAYLSYNPFTDLEPFTTAYTLGTRPWARFFEVKNVPLIYDCGVSGFAYPSYTTPCNAGTDSVVVWLKNYGVSPMNSVSLFYSIDGGTPVQHTWSGTLNGGDSCRVLMNASQTFTVGYHTIRAWVDDSILVGSTRYRDHEPFNDTANSPFAACQGAYSGTRTIGQAGANIPTLEKLLYALSRCGISAPLTVKLPAGTYDVTKFPYIPGTSATNYVLFEPVNASARVTFRRSRQGVNTNAEALVDLTEARSIRFNNIRFANGTNNDNRCNTLALLGTNSNHCQFLNCTFVDSNTVTAMAVDMLNTGEADSVLVSNCTFEGGQTGVNVMGPSPTNRSRHNIVRFNYFKNQANTAISVVNQNDVWVDSNFVDDVLSNTSFMILGQYLYEGSRITRNRIYSTKGASCIGVSDVYGSSTDYFLIANNMLVCLDDGTANQLTTPLNIIKGTYMRVAFNSVRMKAHSSRVGIAAATFGGGVISESYFQNNVVACFDSNNFAFSFMPGDYTSTLHVDHNCYYSISGVLNRLYTDDGSTSFNNLQQWNNAIACETGSVSGNPNFTNSSVSRVDLRSFNAMLRHTGVAVPGVTIDLYGTTRNNPPSMGAYEVQALNVDFTPISFVTPYEEYCGAPASIPVEVAFRNTGSGTYTYTPATAINVYYSIDNGAVQSFNITNRSCGPGDTITFLSTRTMSLPYGANNSDRTYHIRWWVKCSADPDDLNDTANYTVLSRYAAAAPTVINQNVPYGTAATVTPSAGVDLWPVNYYTTTTARKQRAGISWYRSLNDDEKFYYGPSITTSPLFADTTFYISQKRNLPLVKITEVQVNRTAPGATNPMPSFMNSSTAFAVELTNVGDYPANLEGDSILVIISNAAGKVWVLPNVTIQPHQCLVLQFKAMTTPSDSTRTIFSPSTAVASVSYNTNFAVIYRDGGGIADAVAFNSVTTASSTQTLKWSTQNVPQTVWKGNGIAMGTTAIAGARRISWPTSTSTISNTSTHWQTADANHLMQIGTVEDNLILYTDNGCEGNRSAVNLHVTGIPNTDVAVDAPVVDTGCNLTTAETVSVTIHNYGSQTANGIVAKYSLNGGSTVAGTYQVGSLASQSARTITFANTINMHAHSDTVFNVKVWVDAVSTDGTARRANDTNSASFLSRYTPDIPAVPATLSVNYGQTTTITPTNFPTNRAKAVWLNAVMEVLDTTNGPFTTPNIYHVDTFFCQYVGLVDVPSTHVGTLASIMSNNFPSPYNPKIKFVREQYLYTADQIQAAGHAAGIISSVSFYLNSLGSNVTSFNFSNYTINMKQVSQTTFANTTFITGATQVYHNTNLTLTPDNIGWVHHELDTPFQWNGTSSILVEVIRELSTAAITAGANTKYTAQANTVITKQAANNTAHTSTTGTKGNNRPDIMFGFLEPEGCASGLSATLINVTGTPNVDATIEWPAGTDTMTVASCASTALNVKLTNRGSTNINAYTLRYKVDNAAWQQTTGNAQGLQLGRSRTVPLMSQSLTPGRHTVTAVVQVTGDNITSNDTIVHTFNVKFCAGSYTVGTNPGPRGYNSLSIALDTLANAGVAGNVVFLLKEQIHSGQFNIGHIPGTSPTSTVTFTTDSMASSIALIKHTPTSAANYVMKLDGAEYVNFDWVDFYGNYTTGSANTIYANVLQIENSSHINFTNCTIRSKKSAASSTNANLVLLGDNNSYITINHCLLDSGYYAVRTLPTNVHSHNIVVSNCDILNFWYRGVNIRNCDTVFILHDSIASGVTVAGKPLQGIYVANANRVRIEKNFVYLVDNATGGKRGIQISNCKGTNIERVTIYNNMVSVYGTAVASLPSSCIWIDSTSKFVNVYFNTSKLYAGVTQATTRTFSCQLSSNVHVLNNIFSNESKGYAYYVAIDTCVANSNFNVYYSTSLPDTNARTGVITRKFAHWGGVDPIGLDSLRIINQKDQNSFEDMPYLVGTTDLRVALAQFAGVAQYNSDVPQDIFDNGRPQIPAPTIGAHEFNRLATNVSIAEILSPKMPATTTGSNPEVLNIETDSILVHVRFYNNGNSAISGCTWQAFLDGTNPLEISDSRSLPRMNLRTMYEDSVRIASPYGYVDTQRVVIVLETPDGVYDDDGSDNIDTAVFFVYPAYDLKVQSIAITNNEPAGCRLFAVPITYTIKNDGKKDFPGTRDFFIGYDFYCQGTVQPTSGFPGSYYPGEYTQFGEGNDLPVGTTRDITNTMHFPNIYPHGLTSDITVKLRGAVTYQYDPKHFNDTSNYISVTSNHTPESPVGSDTTVDYGSYGNLWATETDGFNANGTPINRVIRWHRLADTTTGEYFYNGTNNYNRSTHWSNTPQYFHDSTYYLSCLSNKNCTSYYSPIHVGINAPLTSDVSISEVVSPRASGRVYLELDTVKLRVANYGSSPASNIPIHYKWMNANGNQTLAECDDTVRVTIPGRVGDSVSTYVFCFDTFLMVNQPLSNVGYQLQAWVSLPEDMQRGNDTLRYAHTFRALAENCYDSILAMAPDEAVGFDITKVSYNNLDFELPDNFGRSSSNMAHYSPTLDNAPVIYVTHGTTDTLAVTVANNADESDTMTTASLCIAIDFNRDGQYDLSGIENITKVGNTRGVSVTSRHAYKQEFTIPPQAHYGFMRMMVWVDGDNTAYINGFRNKSINGQIQQYMLFVQEPDSVVDIDAAVTRVVTPAKHIVTEEDTTVTVMLANNGKVPLTSAQIVGAFYNNIGGNHFDTINWTGSLAPGTSEPVTFRRVNFYEGTTDLMAKVIVAGDTVFTDNDSLRFRFHRFHVVELRFIDSFDQPISKWYVPTGFNNYHHNYFDRSTPAKSHINAPASQPNAFVTGPTQVVSTGTRGNRSEIYTPIIDISQIQPDTINFELCKNMLNGSHLKLQFFDYMGLWQDVDYPAGEHHAPQNGAKSYEGDTTSWYDDPEGWTGSTGAGEYVSYMLPTSLIRGDFPQNLQFRFVYTTPIDVSGASFGDGVAIDNFRVGRARRAVDVGVTDIVYPTNPKFGETIRPTVKIKNYGTDSIRNFEVGYVPWGHYLPMEARCELTIQPDSEVLYTFPDPFTITNNFPDTFNIAAFTKPATDYYWDNDTCIKAFGLSPLANDLQMLRILSPMSSAVAGDTIPITVVIRNFGTEEVDECDVYYTYNGGAPIREHIRFADYLGRNLESTETFPHTFTTRRERATMGTMRVTAYCDYARDSYRLNDTISKTTQGRAAITDLEASSFFFDTRDHTGVRIGLSVANVGARAVSDFDACFFVDRDPNTLSCDHVHIDPPLPAGSQMVYLFDSVMATRTSPWEYCTAWVSVPDDTNHTNDTTRLAAEMHTDLALLRVEVEENRYDSCRVRFVIRNEGNITFYKPITMQFTINGLKVKATIPDSLYFIQPGETRHILMVKNGREVKVPQSYERIYTGQGQLLDIDADYELVNNKTNNIVVLNYFEGIEPVESASGFVVEQNVPNPFDKTTKFDFAIPARGSVRLTVTDVVGRQVFESVKVYDEGRHTVTMDRRDWAAGVYYYTVEYDGESQMHKMIVR